MAFLKPGKTWSILGVPVKDFFLTEHNPNGIAMPSKRKLELFGVTVHNTPVISAAKGTTMSEQYTRATYNGNMGTVRVHYYVCPDEIWHNLPDNWQSWHAGQKGKPEANGSHYGNQATISVEVIGSGAKAEDNAAKLIAYLLYSNGLTTEDLYTHNYWCNVRNGVAAKAGEDLKTKPDGYKGCPAYIIPHWELFVGTVDKYIKQLKNESDNVDKADGTFKVRALDVALNIREKAGTSSKVVGVITDGGIYTITETTKVGSVEWGRLKSGVGWISLGNKYVVKL